MPRTMIQTTLLAALMVSASALPAMARDAAPGHKMAMEAANVEDMYKGLNYRFVGPYRGGRVTTVTGVNDDPMTYYMGAAGGGVWKTSNAGQTWDVLSDEDFKTGTVGAIDVSDTDPNVVYVGMGESPIRGVTTSHGDGVYKSTDAGKSWTHLGLEATRQISALVVHPTNPDVAWVAAQGNPYAPTDERGIYMTTDGGKTWAHTLKVDGETGASDLVIDPSNPRVLYAAMWTHGRNPHYVKSGSENGGIYKSTDGGLTWDKLSGGLPAMVGKIGVAVAASSPNTVYAVIESNPGEGGVYRSDDGGSSWSQTNASRLVQARPWYYNHINVDPTDENTVYVLNAPLLKSIDGGKSFTPMRAPHGDHHDLWFNPEDGDNFVNGSDGGATVTFDGGKTWSSIHNQPTAQFYRVITDNLKPYTIYGGQQDNSTMAIASDDFDGRIDVQDQFTIGGGESAHVAFDENDPRYIYATTINSTLTEYDAEQKRTRLIKPYPEYVFGRDVKDMKYRFNWNAPVIVSPHDPKTIYYGAQMLLKSTDRGITWEEISGDLTTDNKDQQGKGGGPITNEQAGAEFYNTIFYIAESPHKKGVIYVGSDDGLVHVTQDGGRSWTNVTPKGAGEALINAIEISPHDPGTAYIAVAGYKMNDFTPKIFQTRDYGRTWSQLGKGLPEDTFVRVVREDPVKPGQLYAGTEAGAFVSFNRGKAWNSLDLNLPPVPITDMTIRQNDLVVATQGRGFYVLDDLHVLQEITPEDAGHAVHLYAMEDTIRQSGGSGSTGSGDPSESAKPRGALISYSIAKSVDLDGKTLSIDIHDAQGDLVRHFSSVKSAQEACQEANGDARRPRKISNPKVAHGYNSWTWNLNRADVHCAAGVKLFAGFSGPRVMPGDYKVTVSLGDMSKTKPLTILADPREPATPTQYAELEDYLSRTAGMLDELLRAVDQAKSAHAAIKTQMAGLDGDAAASVKAHGDEAMTGLEAFIATVTQPKHETFEDDINWPNMMDTQIRHLMDALDRADAPVTGGGKDRFNDLKSGWEAEKAKLEALGAGPIAALNTQLSGMGVTLVPVPGGAAMPSGR